MTMIILADDHEIIRYSISRFLSSSNVELVSLASDGKEAVREYKKHHPDVIVLDLEMPNKSGLLAAREILHFDPSAHIVVYSGNLGNTYISVLKELGVLGFVQKGGMEELVQAIECARRGEVYYCAESTQNIRQQLEQHHGNKKFSALTLNEKIVALLLAYSMSLENIANALHIENVTARTHKHNIFKKLGVHSIDELYALSARMGIYTMHKKAA